MKVTLIAAMGRQRELATEDGVPWELPEDSSHFRDYCDGKWLLVGRKTFEEMDGWFKNHHPIVMSRSVELEATPVVQDVDGAIQLTRDAGADELVVIGGAQIYGMALSAATHMVLTLVDGSFGDAVAFFPEWDSTEWILEKAERHPADDQHDYSFEIRFLRRSK